MSFDKLTPNQKIQACNIDVMRHHKFALLSGIVCMGKSEVKEGIPTAATDGKNKYYGAEFIKPMNRKQLRYLVLHENFHVALKHCLLFKDWTKRAPQLTNIAQDFVVNALIEELDPEFKFVERPTEALCIDDKYKGWSFPQVFNDLLKNAKIIEAKSLMTPDKWNLYSMDLSSWANKGSIDKIKIWFSTNSATVWDGRYQVDQIGFSS